MTDRPDPEATALDLSGDLKGFFSALLQQVANENGFEPSAVCSSYLTGLLADFARPEPRPVAALDKPFTLLLVEARNCVGGERFERLRHLGDTMLYLSGFFREYLETRGVELSYFNALGAHAFDEAGAMLKVGQSPEPTAVPDVFEELACNFGEHTCLLKQAADELAVRSAQEDPRSTLKLYERWLKTGSNAAAEELLTRGLLPLQRDTTLH